MKIIYTLLLLNMMKILRYSYPINFGFNLNFLNKNVQTVIFNKSKKYIDLIRNPSLNYTKNEKFENKRIIKIAPDGINGFYDFGTSLYIKKNYNLDNFLFSGVSSGSWNALFLTFNKDITKLFQIIFNEELQNNRQLHDIQYFIKNKILENYNEKDFDLDKLYICVIQLDKWKYKHFIYTDFISLEDALNCCIASSNIPIFTGDFCYRYQGKLSFDGIFLKYPHLYLNNSYLRIHVNMYNNNKYKIINKKFIHDSVSNGYNDSKKNKNKLDKYFLENTNLF